MARRGGRDEVSWEEAISIVLRERGGAMRYTAIAEEISSRGFKTVANPAASVAAIFSRSINEGNSPFIRVGNGEYVLKDSLNASTDTVAPKIVEEEEPDTGALRAFGMFWQRDYVVWSGQPKLLGRQSEGALEVDFREQVGVYLLHDRDRVIYVGRASDTLFARLKAHTSDRLGGRWDRFSWFGLKPVGEDGALGVPSTAWTHEIVIETLEALLIESLEPPLNRKRGDNFSGAEYLQVLDPDIENRRLQQVLGDILSSRKN
jgi:HB1, ASXL, restriction endonuclease HTH domain